VVDGMSTPAAAIPPADANPGPRTAAAPLVFIMRGHARFATGAVGVESAPAALRHFPNGELQARISTPVDGRHCIVVGTITPPTANLAWLTLLAHTLRRAGASRITALLPYLAYARQDRALPTQSLGLAWVGELLRASGIDDVTCVDVHSGAAPSVLGLPVTSLSPAALLATALPAAWREQVTFVAPDEGAIDRCAAIAVIADPDRPIAWVRKRRTPTGVEHLGFVGTLGRRVLIVDDILDTGETLLSCCRELRALGVEEIGVLATHALFTGERWRGLFREGVTRLWLTDSVLSRRRPPDAELVPLAPLLAPLLTGSTD
jgi:ribose-phosphate pyrophosphokinase